MKDKGFELRYSKLSNRRKFIRTLWCFTVLLLALILFHWRFSNTGATILISIVSIVVGVGQAIITYRKWKAEENSAEV